VVFFLLIFISLLKPSFLPGRDIEVGIPVERAITSPAPFRLGRFYGTHLKKEDFLEGNLKGRGIGYGDGEPFPFPAKMIWKGKFFVVFSVSEKEYITGVLNKEMGPTFPVEALKAQAVLARTYLKRKSKDGFLKTTEMDQRYQYQEGFSPILIEAVEKTEREILLSPDGSIPPVFYHSCCGGETDLPENVWGKKVPGYRSVKDPHCGQCPFYYWKENIPKETILQLFHLPSLREIFLERTESGRVKRVVLKGNGKEISLPGERFREVLGRDKIRSNLFRIRFREDDPFLLIEGSGKGHGVGFCQWGAKEMAEKGYTYREILSFYFPSFRIGVSR
jgi:stage II sporulation protein D